MLGELRHIATVNEDQVWPQLVEFLPDCGVQLGLVQRRHRKRLAGEERLQGAPHDLGGADRNSRYASRVFAQTLDIVEIPCAIAEAEHMHLMARRKVLYLGEGRDL